MSQPERPQRPKNERKRGSRERTEGEANPGTTAQHFHILISPTWIHAYTEREEIAFLKTLSVSKDILLNISHTHTQTHINMQSGIFQTRGEKNGLTETDQHTHTHPGKAQRDYSLLTTAVEHTHRHKNRKLLSRSSVWGSSNWISETFGTNSSDHIIASMTKQVKSDKTGRPTKSKSVLWSLRNKYRLKQSFSSKWHLVSAPHLFCSQPFNLGPLIPSPFFHRS